MEADDIVERVAIALSMADPDERGLPQGVKMAEFYRSLARSAIAAHTAALSSAGYEIRKRDPDMLKIKEIDTTRPVR